MRSKRYRFGNDSGLCCPFHAPAPGPQAVTPLPTPLSASPHRARPPIRPARPSCMVEQNSYFVLLSFTAHYYGLMQFVNRSSSRETHVIHISRDQPSAQPFTKYIGHPSPAPGRLSARASCALQRCAPERVAVRYLWGMVPVSPARTTGSFPRMEEIGTTYITSFPGSSS